MSPFSEKLETAYRISPLIYDAVLEPKKWQGLLDRLAVEFEAQVCVLSFVRPSDNAIRGAFFSSGYDAAAQRFLAVEQSPRTDPRLKRLGMFPNKPMHCRQVVSDEEWHGSELYQQVFEPHGLDYTLAVFLLDELRDIGILVSVLREQTEGPFDQEHIDCLQLYVPHLRRAGQLMAERISNESIGSTLKALLDRIQLAAFVVDARCNVEFANSAARSMLENGMAVAQVRNKLVINDASVHERFTRQVSGMAFGEIPESETFHASIPDEDAAAALHMTVSQVNGEDVSTIGGTPRPFRAAVFINDPRRSYETQHEQLQRLLGLTGAEAEITSRLAEGASPRDIAQQTGRTYETTRWHLKQVMNKTGVRRQSQLVAVVREALAGTGFLS